MGKVEYNRSGRVKGDAGAIALLLVKNSGVTEDEKENCYNTLKMRMAVTYYQCRGVNPGINSKVIIDLTDKFVEEIHKGKKNTLFSDIVKNHPDNNTASSLQGAAAPKRDRKKSTQSDSAHRVNTQQREVRPAVRTSAKSSKKVIDDGTASCFWSAKVNDTEKRAQEESIRKFWDEQDATSSIKRCGDLSGRKRKGSGFTGLGDGGAKRTSLQPKPSRRRS